MLSNSFEWYAGQINWRTSAVISSVKFAYSRFSVLMKRTKQQNKSISSGQGKCNSFFPRPRQSCSRFTS